MRAYQIFLARARCFDAPGGTKGTEASAINGEGAVAGVYTDDAYEGHGYVRQPDSTFTSFDIPTGPTAYSAAINIKGTVAEIGGISKGGNYLGFVHYKSGTTRAINVPKTQEVDATGINTAGVVTGRARGIHAVGWYGFIWTP